jgi:hypothetical protein
MIKKLFQKFLEKSGKSYLIDTTIPSYFFVQTLWVRLLMQARGYGWLQKKVFLGKNCKISNK